MLVSKHEIERKKFSFVLISKHKIERKKFSIQSRKTEVLDPVSKVKIGVSLDTAASKSR